MRTGRISFPGRVYIVDTHANGRAIWDSVSSSNNVDYVLSHPNGWEGKEQAKMRLAAVRAGLIPDNEEGHKRISFVTEGEASLHFAVDSGVLKGISHVRSIFFCWLETT